MNILRRVVAASTVVLLVTLLACSTSGTASKPTSTTRAAPSSTAPTTAPPTTAPTTTAPTTLPPTAGGPTTASGAAALSDVVGQWDGHGRHLSIDNSGRFDFAGRTYVVCGDGPPPCDSVAGDAVMDGATANGTITSRRGNVFTARVSSTNDTDYVPRGTATFVYDPAQDTLTIQPTGAVFCGPSSATGVCGA